MSMTRGVAALACATSIGLAPFPAWAVDPPTCEGTVTVEQSKNLRVVRIVGDDSPNCVRVQPNETGDTLLIDSPLAGTTVLGGTVPLAGVTKIQIDTRDGGDLIIVQCLDAPTVDLDVKGGSGDSDGIVVGPATLRKLKADGGKGNGDGVTASGVVVTKSSSLSGGRGDADTVVFNAPLFVGPAVVGPISLKNFEAQRADSALSFCAIVP